MPAPPRNAMARHLAAALSGNPDFNSRRPGPMSSRADAAVNAVMTLPARLPAALADLLTAGPFGRNMNRMAAAEKSGTPYAEALDYGDVLGSLVMPGAAGAAAVPRNALGAMGSKAFTLDYYGQPVRVLANPRESALKGFLSRTKYQAARRVVDPATGDVYVWDAADPALHAHVAKELGIDPATMQADVIGLD